MDEQKPLVSDPPTDPLSTLAPIVPKIEVLDLPDNFSEDYLCETQTNSNTSKIEDNKSALTNSEATSSKEIDLKVDKYTENPIKRETSKNNNSEAIYCETCDKVFCNNLSFGLHTVQHSNDKKYACHMCKYKTISQGKFSLHIKVHEGKAGFKCEMCDKYFSSNMHAMEHKNFHTGDKPFQCDVCGKSFMFSKFLSSHRRNQHLQVLTGVVPATYDCLPCNKQYTCISGLKRHQQRYHTATFDQSKLCDICGKSLASKDKLKFHRRIHTGYKPFECAMCSKSFTRKDWLKEHERIHTGERPYICSYCGKGFTQRSPLKIHVRSHTGEKPYVCLFCERGFTSKGTMDVHMRKCEGV